MTEAHRAEVVAYGGQGVEVNVEGVEALDAEVAVQMPGVEPTVLFVRHLLRGAGIDPEGSIHRAWSRLLTEAGLVSPEMVYHTRECDLPLEWPGALRGLVVSQLRDRGIRGPVTAAKRRREVDDEDDSEEDLVTSGKVFSVSRVV